MALSQQFLDELRTRTSLSALIGRAVKLQRAGREVKGCCPFHQEKTASFYVNDDKGFAHCFGCAWHGDAIRWLTDHDGLDFMEAVRELAAAAGMEVPAPTREAAERAARIDGVRPALEAAAALYRRELEACGAAREYLAGRGIDADAIAAFGIGWAPAQGGHLRATGITLEAGLAAGLAWQADGRSGETFRGRIMVPVHDARGRLIAFGGRILPAAQPSDTVPKYKNSPDSEIFDKGRTLFNHHRAAPASRLAKRLVVVEGYMDVIGLARVGIAEAVAPMGTALSVGNGPPSAAGADALGGQLELLWRLHPRPILAFDGDAAGKRAAVRACRAALPHAGPGRSLAVALFPAGMDPDDLARAQGRQGVELVLGEAVQMAALLFDAEAAECMDSSDPEAVAAVWAALEASARTIRDEETRAQYLAGWRARFDREISLSRLSEPSLPALHAAIEAEEGGYAWPEETSESERRLILIVRRLMEFRAQKRLLTESEKDLKAVAKATGFDPKALGALVRDLEAEAHQREEHEAIWALYRRVCGVKGPMSEAMLPSPTDARAARVTRAAERRLSRAMVLIDAREGVA